MSAKTGKYFFTGKKFTQIGPEWVTHLAETKLNVPLG